MKLYALMDLCDCEVHGTRGIFTTKQKAVAAAQKILGRSLMTKSECIYLANKYGYQTITFRGQEPYYISVTSANDITFRHGNSDYTGHYEIIEIVADEILPELL